MHIKTFMGINCHKVINAKKRCTVLTLRHQGEEIEYQSDYHPGVAVEEPPH